ncbi:glycogen debranching enzyme isoform X2 [Rhynchophorus ferrugineus]|uniref:glycogen debranching enzyme isoform X2 n=1 Tax=Rhynchophorus ferrugineus TaxID=354439 RepID=UPI003FCE9976
MFFIFIYELFTLQMAAIIAWIVGSITGTKRKEEEPAEGNKQNVKGSGTKVGAANKPALTKGKGKKAEEPTFHTKLSTPIEELIEETINEEINLNQNSATNKLKRKKKPLKKETGPSKSVIEEPGSSSSKEAAPVKSKKKLKPPVEQDVKEDVKVSFITVKEKARKKKIKVPLEKQNSEEVLQSVITKGVVKKTQYSRPSISEHYKQRDTVKDNSNPTQSSIDSSTGLTSKRAESKKSKQVSTTITYASVLINSIPDKTDTLEKDDTELLKQHNELNEASSSIEVLSEYSEDLETNTETTENQKQLCQKSEITSQRDNIENPPSSNKEGEEIQDLTFDVTQHCNIPQQIEENILRIVDLTEEETLDTREEVTSKLVQDSNFDSLSTQSISSTQSKPILIDDCQKEFNDQSKNNSPETHILDLEYRIIENHFVAEPIENILVEKTNGAGLTDFSKEDSLNLEAEDKNTSEQLTDAQENFENGFVYDYLSDKIDPNSVSLLEDQNKTIIAENYSESQDNIIKGQSTFEITSVSVTEPTSNPQIKEKVDADSVSESDKSKLDFSNFICTQGADSFEKPQETSCDADTHSPIEEQEIPLSEDQAGLEEEVEGNTSEVDSSPEESQTFEEVVVQASLAEEADNTSGNTVTPSVSSDSKKIQVQETVNTPFGNMAQIRVLTLNDKEHQESTIYRIEKNFILQFRLGPSLLGRKIKLYCNYPQGSADFNRGTYQLLEWVQDEGCKNADDTALYTSIEANISGSFHYYFIYENEDTEDRQGSGYFLVDPVLKYGNGEELPLDCIQCQTVLAKQLGPFSTWTKKLQVAKESGYNVIHFTPIQELGASNSSYSLSEQLKLNPLFDEEDGTKITFEDVEKFAAHIRKEWKVLSICDIVLNHTANESKWLKDHPDATYNCVNCPYMRPAYLLDAAFHTFSMDVKKGNYEHLGIPAEVCTEEHLSAIRYHFKTQVLEPLNIPELFTVDVNKYLEEFLCLARKTPPVSKDGSENTAEIIVIQDPEYRRIKSTIDLELALKIYNVYRQDCFDEESRVKRCTEDLKTKLDTLNQKIIDEVNDDLNAAVENVICGIRYYRVQADGPHFKDITESHPLVYRYFTDFGSPTSLEECEAIMYSDNGKYLMAHNGWVMNSDPLKNFASPGTKIYIRRELIAWGDSVKLRYGDKPEDSPFLWEHMRKYVETTAKIFDGVRLDNCHSTPIPVAEYLLDCARKIRPDLYVVAELFTNSDLTDNIFVNRLGITSLIREAMSAWDSHEEGRLVYRYGGMPVGSFYQPNVRPLVPMVAHALFLDLTHDNPSPVEKRSVFDLLPSSALVNMACCASGSNRGYDELVPHHIHVVDETRQYTEWTDDDVLPEDSTRYVNAKSGIITAKRALNELHYRLGKEGYNQVYVDQMNSDVVAVTRHNPETHSSFVLVAFTAFGHPDINAGNYQIDLKPLRIEGVLDEIVLEASMSHVNGRSGGSKFARFENFVKDPTWINGVSEYEVSIKQHIQINESDVFEEVYSGTKNMFQLNFRNFKPGSVVVIKVSLPKEMGESIKNVRELIGSFSAKKDSELNQIIGRMSLADINRALYRCDQEERDEGKGLDAYNIPNFGPLVYCGLQGFMSLLANIRPNNDLGHPFCGNLRDGNWMIDYMWKRLKVDEGTKELGQWIEEHIKYLYSVPRYLIPCYFDVIVTGIYVKLLDQSYNLMSNFVKFGSTFVKGLSLGSLQFGAYIKSADLPALSPNLAPPKPPTRKNNNNEDVQACVSLSAGLPHFSVGYMRNWGRDTFIALRGLFILTGRYEESRQHILGYAACLRHGLIPNLLDGGRNSRFNCRDAIWWWLYCIKSYCEEVPNGIQILSDKVSRIFPTDESTAQPPGAVDQPLYDVIQEGLKVHFQGLKFRERNAGRQIDEHMTDAGFNNQIGIHPETGFVFGGNQWNCGTWMDKMGSSDKAHNRGKPATPRDGSAVELVGLSKAAISWLWKLNQEGHYPYDGVERIHKNGSTTKWTFKAWAEKIQQNFESKFWIGPKPSSDETRADLINKKNIYKDSFAASQPWTDYQLRCNFPIAMVAAPELFNPQHAWAALEQVEKYLLGPLGMKTLDPEDWNYRGDYNNSNDSDDFHISHGFNYHQGPEWVWPVGFFLRAKLIFAAQNNMLKETVAATKIILSKHFTELQTSPWRGLPELTNSNGSYCKDSSRTQAWSMSCILEVLYDLQQVESKQLIAN